MSDPHFRVHRFPFAEDEFHSRELVYCLPFLEAGTDRWFIQWGVGKLHCVEWPDDGWEVWVEAQGSDFKLCQGFLEHTRWNRPAQCYELRVQLAMRERFCSVGHDYVTRAQADGPYRTMPAQEEDAWRDCDWIIQERIRQLEE